MLLCKLHGLTAFKGKQNTLYIQDWLLIDLGEMTSLLYILALVQFGECFDVSAIIY